MKIENLKVGQVLKSYRHLCEVLEVSTRTGKSKQIQMNDLERYLTYHKEGNKFIIDSIFDIEKEKVDNRINNKGGYNYINYEQFNIPRKDGNNIGIYCILKDSDIYIGSTYAGFRDRFRGHYRGQDEVMRYTYDLLHSGGQFNVLLDMTGIEDEALVRQVEHEFILYLIDNSNYNVLNKNEKTWSFKEKTKLNKTKYKTIKIEEDKYEEALSLLLKNGLITIDSKNEVTPIINFNIESVPF